MGCEDNLSGKFERSIFNSPDELFLSVWVEVRIWFVNQ